MDIVQRKIVTNPTPNLITKLIKKISVPFYFRESSGSWSLKWSAFRIFLLSACLFSSNWITISCMMLLELGMLVDMLEFTSLLLYWSVSNQIIWSRLSSKIYFKCSTWSNFLVWILIYIFMIFFFQFQSLWFTHGLSLFAYTKPLE